MGKGNIQTKLWILLAVMIFFLVFAVVFDSYGFKPVFWSGCAVFLAAFLLVWAAVLHSVTKSVQSLHALLGRLMEGDYQDGFDGKAAAFVGEIGALADRTEAVRRQTQEMIGGIRQDAAGILHAMEGMEQSAIGFASEISDVAARSGELAGLMQDTASVADRLGQISSEIREAAAQLSVRIENGAVWAEAVHARAHEAEEEAEERREWVKKNHPAVKECFERGIRHMQTAGEIETLIESVLEFMEKTNLLALNASLEAAKAGEAGKGFSLVAEEIRDVADKSRKQAERIQWLAGEAGLAAARFQEDAAWVMEFLDAGALLGYERLGSLADAYSGDAREASALIDGCGTALTELSAFAQSLAQSADGAAKAAGDGGQCAAGVAQAADGAAGSAGAFERELRKAGHMVQALEERVQAYRV